MFLLLLFKFHLIFLSQISDCHSANDSNYLRLEIKKKNKKKPYIRRLADSDLLYIEGCRSVALTGLDTKAKL